MSPILGIVASQNYSRITGAFESIATVTGNGSSSTVTFSSIPSTYKHLQLRIISRVGIDSASLSGNLMTFNSDTGSNYTFHSLRGDGTNATAVGFATGTYSGFLINSSPASQLLASTHSVNIVDIHDYSDTSKNKTARLLGGYDFNGGTGGGNINLRSSAWLNTSAISDITITNLNSGNYVAGSTFSLYGVK